MNELPRLRIDLELPRQNFASMLETHNQEVLDACNKGVERAVKELSQSETLEQMAYDQARQYIQEMMRHSIFDGDVKQRILKKIQDQVNDAVEDIAKTYTEGILENLSKGGSK